jgi:drug/metabolite transporter (DMT)-like permease
MTTIIAFSVAFPGFLANMLGWLGGALVILGVFLFNRSRLRAHSHE